MSHQQQQQQHPQQPPSGTSSTQNTSSLAQQSSASGYSRQDAAGWLNYFMDMQQWQVAMRLAAILRCHNCIINNNSKGKTNCFKSLVQPGALCHFCNITRQHCHFLFLSEAEKNLALQLEKMAKSCNESQQKQLLDSLDVSNRSLQTTLLDREIKVMLMLLSAAPCTSTQTQQCSQQATPAQQIRMPTVNRWPDFFGTQDELGATLKLAAGLRCSTCVLSAPGVAPKKTCFQHICRKEKCPTCSAGNRDCVLQQLNETELYAIHSLLRMFLAIPVSERDQLLTYIGQLSEQQFDSQRGMESTRNGFAQSAQPPQLAPVALASAVPQAAPSQTMQFMPPRPAHRTAQLAQQPLRTRPENIHKKSSMDRARTAAAASAAAQLQHQQQQGQGQYLSKPVQQQSTAISQQQFPAPQSHQQLPMMQMAAQQPQISGQQAVQPHQHQIDPNIVAQATQFVTKQAQMALQHRAVPLPAGSVSSQSIATRPALPPALPQPAAAVLATAPIAPSPTTISPVAPSPTQVPAQPVPVSSPAASASLPAPAPAPQVMPGSIPGSLLTPMQMFQFLT